VRAGVAREQADDRARMRETQSRWRARARETSAAAARRGRFTSSMAAVVGRRRSRSGPALRGGGLGGRPGPKILGAHLNSVQ
jgi:hypothetical protein